VAQLGATIGRTFAYELLQAVSCLDNAMLQQSLWQLVDAELVYQQGVPPQATYVFKHALIQDAAYQSLLRSTRQQYHQRIAQVLEARFAQTTETQPELLAHHYTEAGLAEQAIGYWQRAGRQAAQRSAHVEAIAHLTKGLALLQTLPDTIERAEHELLLQTTLGPSLIATKGYAAPEVEQAYARAQKLCQQQMGKTSLLFPVLWALWASHSVRGRAQIAHGLAEQLLHIAQSAQDPALRAAAHRALGTTLHFQGAFASARVHLEHGMALYDPQKYCSPAFLSAEHPGIICQCFLALTLWYLGYPEQALRRIHDACMVAQQLAHAYSLVHALDFAAWLHQHRREEQLTQERATATLTLATEQGFAFFVPRATAWRGWVLVEQGHVEHGIAQIRQAITNRAIGVEDRQYCLTVLAEAHGKAGQTAEGLRVLAEVCAVIDSPGACYWEAEVYRLKGKLLLALPAEHHAEAEACFHQALALSRRQQAKSLELRAATSLARLWQRQGKRQEAYDLLAPVYNWFTEGFDTADLQDAKMLLDALGEQRHDI
jgi:predicted ATPase